MVECENVSQIKCTRLLQIEDEADLKDEDEVELSLDELQKLTEVNGIPQVRVNVIFYGR